MNSYSLTTKLFLCSTLFAAVNCGGTGSSGNTSNLQGQISDGDGGQKQSLKIRTGKFGGAGTLSAAVKVRVSQLKADGTLEVVAEGAIQSGGRYLLSIPTGLKRLVAESLDISGNVVASVIVEASGAVGETVTVCPMDTETSIEAAVMAKMAASGVALDDINAIELRAWISANVAVAVRAAADSEVKIKALAEAIAAAQVAKIKGYASVGITTTQSALFEAELAAAHKLDVALDAAAGAQASVDQAYANFHSDLMAIRIALDGSVKKHARAESIASVAFRAVVKARLSASGDAVLDASLRAAASAEARVSAAVVASILASGSAAADVTAAAKSAETSLYAQLTASTSVAASAAAYLNWTAALCGTGSVMGSVLGNYLSVNATTSAALQLSINAVATAATTLDASLRIAANTLNATSAIDFNVLAQSCVTAYTTFQSTVDIQAAALVALGAKVQASLDIMATANGSFRLQ